MRLLGGREGHLAVWDSVNWELSTTYFTLATLLQDYAPLSRKAQEQVDLHCLNCLSFLLADQSDLVSTLQKQMFKLCLFPRLSAR